MLAALLEDHPGELRADFQRFYGLNLDGMGTEYSVAHAATLAAHLPQESACVRVASPEAAWDDATYLLAAIEYDLRVLAWQNSRDGAKGRNKPRPVQTPADVARVRDKLDGTDLAEVAAALGIPYMEVEDG